MYEKGYYHDAMSKNKKLKKHVFTYNLPLPDLQTLTRYKPQKQMLMGTNTTSRP